MADTKLDRYRTASRYKEQLASVEERGLQDSLLKTRYSSGANGKPSELNSWDTYRNWLTKVQAPEARRSIPDPALFSWKGYRSWAEKVRRDWEPEE